jgi:hypothetical protein
MQHERRSLVARIVGAVAEAEACTTQSRGAACDEPIESDARRASCARSASATPARMK